MFDPYLSCQLTVDSLVGMGSISFLDSKEEDGEEKDSIWALYCALFIFIGGLLLTCYQYCCNQEYAQNHVNEIARFELQRLPGLSSFDVFKPTLKIKHFSFKQMQKKGAEKWTNGSEEI